MEQEALNEALRSTALRLISEKSVDVVLGYRKGTLPLRSQPVFARSGEAASELIFDLTCENNLVSYLPKLKGKKVGIVLKACDSKALVEHLKEKQFERKDLVLIGVQCPGVLDRKRIDDIAGNREITWANWENGVISFGGADWKESRPLQEVLHDSCKNCGKVPVISDIRLWDGAADSSDQVGNFDDVRTFENLPPEERWKYFVKETSKCIRCYACIKECPACYCKECFVDRTQPAIVGKTLEQSDVMMFHLIRALHLAGRCVDCGACVRACPMGVDLRFLNRKLQKDVVEMFNYVAGMAPDSAPLLSAFSWDDPEGFIKNSKDAGTSKCSCDCQD